MTNWGKCPVCGSPAKIGDTHGDNVTSWKIECIRCGNYVIKDNIVDFISGIKNPSSFTFNFNMETAAIASSWIHNKVRTGITTFSIDELKHLNSLQSPTFTEKANNLLLWIAKKSPIPGRSTGFNRSDVNDVLNIMTLFRLEEVEKKKDNIDRFSELIATVSLIDSSEFTFIFKEYLQIEKKYLNDAENPSITPAGWAHIEKLRARNPQSNKAFVAMWFDDEMIDICEKFIIPATKDAGGFDAIPVNKDQYNNDINDQIIANINQSRFVIADFTGNRSGVYYEAGYARGLNIPVIYTCREDWFNTYILQEIKVKDGEKEVIEKKVMKSEIHFDVNHQNFILWKDGDDLKEKLINRINATINRPK